MRTAVITGGAGGLGRALTMALVAKGWNVAVLDLPGAQLDAVAGPAVRAYACDVTAADAVAEVCARVVEDHASIDLVVYNAGITQIGLFAETPLSAHRRVFEINYFGAVNVAAALLKPVRRTRGTHLAISSVAGFAPLHRRTAYSASKHALEGLTESLRQEIAPFGVRVSIVEPGFVRSGLRDTCRRDAPAFEIYQPQRDTALAAFDRRVQNGAPPETVARAIHAILQADAPRLRYAVGSDAQAVALGKRLAPYALFEQGYRLILGLDRWQDAARRVLPLPALAAVVVALGLRAWRFWSAGRQR